MRVEELKLLIANQIAFLGSRASKCPEGEECHDLIGMEYLQSLYLLIEEIEEEEKEKVKTEAVDNIVYIHRFK